MIDAVFASSSSTRDQHALNMETVVSDDFAVTWLLDLWAAVMCPA